MPCEGFQRVEALFLSHKSRHPAGNKTSSLLRGLPLAFAYLGGDEGIELVRVPAQDLDLEDLLAGLALDGGAEGMEEELTDALVRDVRRGRAAVSEHGEGELGEVDDVLQLAVRLELRPLALVEVADLAHVVLDNGSTREVVNQVRNQFLPEHFDSSTHGQHFRVQLWVEEHRMADDLRMYDIEGARFTQEGRLWTLPVPGLAEKRPSVVPGDTILTQIGGADGRTNRGFVHFVNRDSIRVAFHSSFKGNARYNVRFEYNRTPIKRQHQALLAPSTSSQRLLFPPPGFEGLHEPISPAQAHLNLFNALISTNPGQLQAVKSIQHLREGSAPFIVFGPPGTGKTVTIGFA
ncbi:hypothetical protein NUW54_g2430 [Trametes sanguinea]|uniref:Uncharacterized protein n=1 Tax=Trametes sanguinea TaxID=158606 RepID=A0ACC1Q7B7_9APHY|nr:hypothetical protein NUW54_g2430 [Trametes sanguinea]